jgi:hypothetical protein
MTTLGDFAKKASNGTLTDDEREAWEFLRSFHVNSFEDLEVEVLPNAPPGSPTDGVDKAHDDAERKGKEYEARRKDGRTKMAITRRLYDLALRHGAKEKA